MTDCVELKHVADGACLFYFILFWLLKLLEVNQHTCWSICEAPSCVWTVMALLPPLCPSVLDCDVIYEFSVSAHHGSLKLITNLEALTHHCILYAGAGWTGLKVCTELGRREKRL